MKIPKRVTISGRVWRVVREQPPTDPNWYGECDLATYTIRLSPKLRGEDLAETFLHELLHACVPEADLFAKGTDELFVSIAAPRLLSALRNLGWIDIR